MAREARVVVEVEAVEGGDDVGAVGGDGGELFREVGVALSVAGSELLEPGRPGEDLVGGAGGLGVRRNPGEHRGVGLAGADGGEKGIGGEAGETEEPLVERTGVDVVAGAAGGVGAAPTRGARNHTSVSIAMPAIAPGTTPPRKRSPIDTPVTEP